MIRARPTSQFAWRQVFQTASEGSDGGAHGADDDNFSAHGEFSCKEWNKPSSVPDSGRPFRRPIVPRSGLMPYACIWPCATPWTARCATVPIGMPPVLALRQVHARRTQPAARHGANGAGLKIPPMRPWSGCSRSFHLCGMQHQARGRRHRRWRRVQRVADDGMPDGQQMHAQLVVTVR